MLDFCKVAYDFANKKEKIEEGETELRQNHKKAHIRKLESNDSPEIPDRGSNQKCPASLWMRETLMDIWL